VGGLGATIALPGVLAGHPIHEHFASALALDDTKTASPVWTPEFLNTQQNESFTLLAERIVPGSAKAQVNRIVDLLLTIDTPANQKAFLASLAGFEAEAQKHYSKPLEGLSEIQQNELLTMASTALGSETYESNQMPATLRDSFENLKGWSVGAYYSTEQGMRELGWSEDFYFEAPAECEHEGGHH
jgi:Gluconate 2-dehydrogenase subunit 3